MHTITHGAVRTPKESLHWKLTIGEKSLTAPGNRTCVGGVPVRCSTNWATSPPTERQRNNQITQRPTVTGSDLSHQTVLAWRNHISAWMDLRQSPDILVIRITQMLSKDERNLVTFHHRRKCLSENDSGRRQLPSSGYRMSVSACRAVYAASGIRSDGCILCRDFRCLIFRLDVDKEF